MNPIVDLTDLFASPNPPGNWAVGTVQTITANGSDPPLVTVMWLGREVPARCPRHYTPVVGHQVLMARPDRHQLLILCAY